MGSSRSRLGVPYQGFPLSLFTVYGSRPSMIIARILGTVVSTQKDERLKGSKLLLVRPLNLDGSDGSGHIVAVGKVGAGFPQRASPRGRRKSPWTPPSSASSTRSIS